MGAAPSAEILREAPFRPARGDSGRVIALIPMTADFFPSPESQLFGQLYEARCDPYVRYYLRRDANTDVRLDVIPPIAFTREEYYAACMDLARACRLYETTNELRQCYMADPARHHRLVRPVPCAVAFLYNDRRDTPEGCVVLGGACVTVIGGIGCELKTSDADAAAPTLELMIFLRRSAGDHNMVRAMLFASWLFHAQCKEACGLPRVPMLPVSFRALKTNIPFLCFLREMRNRVDLLHENTAEHSMWIDGAFVCGAVTAEHAAELCEAFAAQYRLQLEAKAGAKPDTRPLPLAARLVDDSSSSSVDAGETGCTGHGLAAARFHKQFFTLAGFIETDDVVIPAATHSSNEVYVVCVDALVHVAQRGEEAAAGDTDGAGVSGGFPLKVRRGDIIRFVPAAAEQTQGAQYPSAEGSCTGATEGAEDAEARQARGGSWQVDATIHLENVLLSFVHDECKSAREAQASDPHWLRDKETGELVADGGFLIWCFERKGTKYFYGTVPRFANAFRHRREAARRAASRAEAEAHDPPAGEEGGTQRKGAAAAAARARARAPGKGASQAHAAPEKEREPGHRKDDGRLPRDAARLLPWMVVNDVGPGPVIPCYPPLATFAPLQPCYADSAPLMMMSPSLAYGSVSGGLSGDSRGDSLLAPDEGSGRRGAGRYGAPESPPPPCLPVVQAVGMPPAPSVQYVPYAHTLPPPPPPPPPPLQTTYYCVYPALPHSGMQPLQPISYLPTQLPPQPNGNPLFIMRP
ncbi:uncharacterized protein Tco025E_02794 [Trypanosoma conorhini]|uniref:Uncharacterized protein n=1 Tax=Trypanosoma conorhini TaxID=83891 RepID=A0A422Q0H5_9TRYP|nr:uncharacterized protein Tco025E_02794 [Trypanosoma conorhini]RNF23502.1 hypothetical protein Tco025E_02794 [Trypanosoma conorhini]